MLRRLIIAALGWAAMAPAQTSDTTSVLMDSVAYTAQVVNYDVQSGTIVLSGRAEVTYQGMTLTADTIMFRTSDDLLIAYGGSKGSSPDTIVGPPTFSDPYQTVVGHRFTYDLRIQRGVVEDATTDYQNAHYTGRRIKRTGIEQLDISDGGYTTCDDDDPHYIIESNQMRLLVDDKVIAKPVVMRLADVPIVWFPFGVFFVSDDRQSGFLTPKLGENHTAGGRGRFMDNLGYYLAPNEYLGMEARTSIDEKKGWDVSLRSAYNKRYSFNGALNVSYRREWTATKRVSWFLNSSHRQQIDPHTTLTSTAQFSNSEELDGVSQSTSDRIKRQLRSDATISRNWPESRRSASIRISQDLDLRTDRTTEVLPSVSLSQGSTPIISPVEQRGPRARRLTARNPRWYERAVWNWRAGLTNTRRRAASESSLIDVWVFDQDISDSTETYELTLEPVSGFAQENEPDGRYVVVRREDGVLVAEGVWKEQSESRWLLYDVDSAEPDGSLVRTGGDEIDVVLPGSAVIGTDPKSWRRKPVPAGLTQDTRLGLGISAPQQVGRWLTITPGGNWSQTWMSEDTRDSLGRATGIDRLDFGLATAATVHGIFPVGMGLFEAFRHTISPRVRYSYNIESRTVDGRLGLGGERDTDDPSRRLNLSLTNQFDAKLKWSGDVHTFNRLITATLSTSYNFDPPGTSRRKLQNLSTRISIKPDKRFDSQVSLSHDFHDKENNRLPLHEPRLLSATLTNSLRLAGELGSVAEPGREDYVANDPGQFSGSPVLPGDIAATVPGGRPGSPWKLTLRHQYTWSDRVGTSRHELDATAGGSPTKDWRVDYRAHFDIERKKITSYQLTVKRSLHCWQASLLWEPKGRNKGFYFIIHVVDIPEIKMEAASANRRGIRY